MLQESLDYIIDIDRRQLPIIASMNLLRRLSIDEFGQLLLMLPSDHMPHLSTILPKNTPDQIQKDWAGSSGETLLRQSVSFMNFVSSNCHKFISKDMSDISVLDFGCGWGRLLRLFLYFADPHQLYGCDAWESSLQHSRDANLLGTLAKSDVNPSELPFPNIKFDLIYAFSIFTHLPLNVMSSCLTAFRHNIGKDGLAIITIRPLEYWDYVAKARGSDVDRLKQEHVDKGFAFLADNASNPDYGASSVSLEFLESTLESWRIVRAGTTMADGMQKFVCLKPV